MLVVRWCDMKTSRPKTSIMALLAACCLAIAGCASMTVDGRIEQNYDAFNRLSPAQQAEVRAGRVAVGMPETAVYMALGAPSARAERVTEQGGHELMWIYSRLAPVAVWPVDYYPYGWPASPQWVYQKEPVAKIIFRDGKVASWEQSLP